MPLLWDRFENYLQSGIKIQMLEVVFSDPNWSYKRPFSTWSLRWGYVFDAKTKTETKEGQTIIKDAVTNNMFKFQLYMGDCNFVRVTNGCHFDTIILLWQIEQRVHLLVIMALQEAGNLIFGFQLKYFKLINNINDIEKWVTKTCSISFKLSIQWYNN